MEGIPLSSHLDQQKRRFLCWSLVVALVAAESSPLVLWSPVRQPQHSCTHLQCQWQAAVKKAKIIKNAKNLIMELMQEKKIVQNLSICIALAIFCDAIVVCQLQNSCFILLLIAQHSNGILYKPETIQSMKYKGQNTYKQQLQSMRIRTFKSNKIRPAPNK